jgi:polyhydroxyalkanoate synthesis regulator phasin
MNRKLAGTGLAIGLVAGAGAGLILELSGNVGAAAGNPTAVVVGDSTDATTDTAVPADPVRPDPSTRLGDVLKPLVDDGTITQDQADKVIAAIVAARPVGGPGMGGPMGGGHRGPGGPGGRIGFGLDVVATTLGITADEVRTALEGGQSLADLAVSKGKTAQDVIDAIVAEATTKLNTAVTDGKLTQAEADARLADITTHATEFVNNTPPVGGPGFGPGFGGPGFGGPGFGGPGHHGDDNDADDDAPVGATAPTDTTATTDTVAG